MGSTLSLLILSYNSIIFSSIISCSSNEKTISTNCDPGGPLEYINALVTTVNGSPWIKRNLFDFDLPVQRDASQNTTITIAYDIVRVSGECIIQYNGPLSFSFNSLPPGISAIMSPPILQNSSNEIQKLQVTIQISPEYHGTKFDLYLINTEKVITLPVYSVVITSINH